VEELAQMNQDGKKEATLDLSVIIPVCNQANKLLGRYTELVSVLERLGKKYEIVFVDDGSVDNTFQELSSLRQQEPRVKVISFGRRFGNSACLSSGINHSSGKIIVTMNTSLWVSPSQIPKLLEKIEDGFDFVIGWRSPWKDPRSYRFLSRTFNMLSGLVTDLKIHDTNCELKVFRREAVENVRLYGNLYRFLPLLVHREGFKVGETKVIQSPRKSKNGLFSPQMYVRRLFDLFTVFFLTRYTKKPLHLFGGIGLLFFVTGFLISAYLTFVKLSGHAIGGRPLLLLGVLLLVVGVQVITIGLLGELLIFTHAQDTKEYNIREILD
jgi:glycosyltransferase involved in cell wall biosynthesis